MEGINEFIDTFDFGHNEFTTKEKIRKIRNIDNIKNLGLDVANKLLRFQGEKESGRFKIMKDLLKTIEDNEIKTQSEKSKNKILELYKENKTIYNNIINVSEKFEKVEKNKIKIIKRFIDIFKEKNINTIKLTNLLKQSEEKFEKLERLTLSLKNDRRTTNMFINQIKFTRQETTEPQTQQQKLISAVYERSSNAGVGTVATVGGFLGITSASIISRIIGNSTANYLSPNNKTIIQSKTIGDDKKHRKDILRHQNEELERLRNEIKHIKDSEEQNNMKGHKQRIKKYKRIKKKRDSIGTINIINRL
jgi:hypothetical protein